MNIKSLRRRAGMTQIALAEKMNVQQSTVAMWESGASMPRADKLFFLARVLNCTVDELLAPASPETREESA